jgi:hypothetical protein
VRQNPGAYAPVAAFTTSPCSKGFSAGGSTPNVAATLGIVLTDKGCDSRQTAVIFHAIGNDYAAGKTLCSTDAAKRAHLTLEDCERLVATPVVISAPPAPIAPPQVIVPVTVIPVPAPAPSAVPVVEERKPTLTLHTVGSCTLFNGKPNNVCYRLLDDAVRALEVNPNARILLTGPVESGTLVPYLQKRVSRSRIEIRLADEQNWTLNIQTEVAQ